MIGQAVILWEALCYRPCHEGAGLLLTRFRNTWLKQEPVVPQKRKRRSSLVSGECNQGKMGGCAERQGRCGIYSCYPCGVCGECGCGSMITSGSCFSCVLDRWQICSRYLAKGANVEGGVGDDTEARKGGRRHERRDGDRNSVFF